MTSRKTTIPPLLHPYLSQPPESSLLLLTGVLNASTHWLSVRVLRGALEDWSSRSKNNRQKEEKSRGEGEKVGGGRNRQEEEKEEGGRHEEEGKEEEQRQDTAVVLVSWQRDFEFWKTEARRGAGLDLARLAQQDRFAFVDGLTHLLSPPTPPTSTPASPSQTLPPRQPAVPSRTYGAPPTRRPAPPTTTTTTTPQTPHQPSPQPSPAPSKPAQPKNHHTLRTPHLPHAHEVITHAINTLTTSTPTRRILLLLDTPSTPLALTPTPSATPLLHLILSLRTLVHSTVISLETDLPFLQPAVHALAQSSLDTTESQGSGVRVQSPLETEMSRLLVGLGHQARWLVSVRGLDTGVARDVSGVVRCSRGGGWDDGDDDQDDDQEEGQAKKTAEKEIEVLYFVQGDGRVNVFERGGGEIG